MLFAMITWGIAWTNAKIVGEYLGYYNLVFLRFLLGFLALLPFILTKLNSFKNIPFLTFINIFSMGILFFIYNYCFFKGTDLGNSGYGGVLVTTTNPVITFLIISAITQKISLNKILGLMLGILGGLIIMDVFNQGMIHILDVQNKYFISCSIVWGIMTVIMSYGQDKMDSLLYIASCYFITTVISIGFINFEEILGIVNFDFRFFIHFFLVSMGAMSFGTSIYIYATPRLGPIQTSVFIFSVPFIALYTAHLVLGESITANVVVGGVLSILSIIIINYEKD